MNYYTATKIDCSHLRMRYLGDLPYTLERLYCDNNELTTLPILPDKLITCWCSYNLLKTLPILPIGLTKLYCDHNDLDFLPDMLPPMLTVLWCEHNNLHNLPNLPPMLTDLRCCNNHLTELPCLPLTLNFLDCSHNKLTHLPQNITTLRNVYYVTYNANPNITISIQQLNWLDNIDFALHKNIYDDAQSVHNSHITKQIKDNIDTLTKNLIVHNDVIDEMVILVGAEYYEGDFVHSTLYLTLKQISYAVYNRIIEHEHKNELLKIFLEQIKESKNYCFTGRITRILSTLVGFCDDITINITDNERIQGLYDYCVLHGLNFNERLQELDVNSVIKNNWNTI